MNNKSTLVLGASLNRLRYSYQAIKLLVENGIETYAVGIKEGKIGSVEINKFFPEKKIHTVCLYLSAINQKEYIKRIIDLKPERIIFNPGTYNSELIQIAKDNNIEVKFACTLILLQREIY